MIQNILGCAGALPIECVSPRKNKWKIRWNITEKEDGTAEWTEQDFDHKPTLSEIKETINNWYNEQISETILSGCRWEKNVVWLSQENQLNYKTAFDTAYQTNGQNLPVIFKLGTEDNPIYVQFDTIERLKAFHLHWTNFITNTLKAGWTLKDSTDWKKYEV